MKTEIDAVEKCFKYGEHIGCVWAEDVGDSLNWHLGVVDKFDVMSYMFSTWKETDNKGKNWLFLEEAKIRLTQLDQIIVRNIQVKYLNNLMILKQLSWDAHWIMKDFLIYKNVF